MQPITKEEKIYFGFSHKANKTTHTKKIQTLNVIKLWLGQGASKNKLFSSRDAP